MGRGMLLRGRRRLCLGHRHPASDRRARAAKPRPARPPRASSRRSCRWTRRRTGSRGRMHSFPASSRARREYRRSHRPVRGVALPGRSPRPLLSTSGSRSPSASGCSSLRCVVATRRPFISETRRVMPRVRFLSAPRAGTVTAHLEVAGPAPARLSLGSRCTCCAEPSGLRVRRARRRSWCSSSPRCWRGARRARASTRSTRISQAHPATAAWIVHRLTGIPFSFTAHANDLFVGSCSARSQGRPMRVS